MTGIRVLTWQDVHDEVSRLCARQHNKVDAVYGIPTGGSIVATLVAQQLGVPLADSPDAPATLVVDDLIDTGRTMRAVRPYGGVFVDTLFRKPWSPADLAPHATLSHDWLSFPWEKDDGDPVDAVIRLLQHVGEDPTRDGLLDTPRRVTKAWRELTKGYRDDPAEILDKRFEVRYDDMVVVKQLAFTSLCEHHILPFVGHATIAYIPTTHVVGLSKLARLLDCYANRLQVQERMTGQIADAIDQHLQPLGVGVVVTAQHTCMSMRGVKKGGDTVTSALRGVFKTNPAARQELMALHNA